VNILRRIRKEPKRTGRWKSMAHLAHVRRHACVNCGSVQNIQAAHVRMGSDGGMGRKPSDFYAVPLCGPHGLDHGCHAEQHRVGEESFWRLYEGINGHSVEDVIEELIRTSPRRQQIEEARR